MKKILLAFLVLMTTIIRVDAYEFEASFPVFCTESAEVVISAIDNAPLPEKTRLTITENNPGKFSMKYTEPGVYKYHVSQEKTRSDYIYDNTEYDVWIYVSFLDDKTMTASVVAKNNKDKAKPDRIIFQNEKKKEEKKEEKQEEKKQEFIPGPDVNTGVEGNDVAKALLVLLAGTILFIKIRKETRYE